MVILFYPEIYWQSNLMCGSYDDYNANTVFLIFFLSIDDWFILCNAACIKGQCLLGFGFFVFFFCRLVLL